MGNVQVSEDILEAMRREAEASSKDVNGLFEEAAQRLLAHREVEELAAYGKSNVRRLRLKPSDAVRFVREDRKHQQRAR
jgi:hypothetical protein